MEKQFAVIGLGRFGSSLARNLTELGADVMAIDIDETLVNEATEYVDEALQLDATNSKALDEIGIQDYDAVAVCVAHEQVSIMIAMLCIEKGAPHVICKAKTDIQAAVLYKIGVEQCVFPEREAGRNLAHKMMTSNILRSIELSDEYGTVEMEAAPAWVGQTLVDLGFRQAYGLNIIALRHHDATININPGPDDVIQDEDRIFVLGSKRDIERVEKQLEKRFK